MNRLERGLELRELAAQLAPQDDADATRAEREFRWWLRENADALLAVAEAQQAAVARFTKLYRKAESADWEGYGEGSVWAMNVFNRALLEPSNAALARLLEDA